MVDNCRAEISPRPVSQDVHLCTTFYLYRLNHVAHTLQILCFCQHLVCFWGDKSRTDYKQPISVSVDSVRLDTLQIVIAHTIYSRVTTPDRKITPVEYELWFLSINSHLARWYKSPSRRAVSSHSTLTPGIFAYLSDGCLWVTRYSLPSRCASRTLDLLRYFSWILEISPLRENKFSLWNNTKIYVLFPYAAPTRKCTPKRDRKNKGTTTRSKLKNLE